MKNLGSDAITTEVIRYSLDGAAEQMKQALIRSAFSSIIYDAHDFACGLYDREVNMLAQSRTMPLFQGTLDGCIRKMLERIGEENIREGDVIVSNYGYEIGAHANDIVLIMPGFRDGELIGYAAAKAHMMDVGGKSPGVNVDSTDIWQEGLILPSVKLYNEGTVNQDIKNILLMNSRLPEPLWGDVNAMIAACRAGLAALGQVHERFGQEQFSRCVEILHEYGDNFVRDFLRGVPNGRWSASGMIDDDGVTDDPIPYTVSVEIRDETMVVDLREVPDQVPGPVNSPKAATVAVIRAALMGYVRAGDSVYEGHYRPIEILTREGSVFDAAHPGSMDMYAWPLGQLADLVYECLAQADASKVPASGCHVIAFLAFGQREGHMFMAAMDMAGGQGAAEAYGDGGAPLMHIIGSGIRSTSWEVWESRVPMLVESSEYDPDSAGAGKYRGGQGFMHKLRCLSDMTFIPICEHSKEPQHGLLGGKDGRPNTCDIIYPDGSSERYSKASVSLPEGSLIELRSNGGGGFGDPAERDPAAIRADLKEGLITEEAARRDYPHAF